MGAFAVGVVSRAMTDIGIEHMGVLQVVIPAGACTLGYALLRMLRIR